MKLITVKSAERFSVVVPRSVASKAVERNLIKRRLREAVIHSFSTKPRAVIIAHPPIVGKKFSEIKVAVNKAMKQL